MQRPQDGIEIARHGAGAGEPIVLLHEGLGSVAMWRDFPSLLAEATDREVIAWSRRGYGDSETANVPYELDFMHREAEAAVQLLDQMDVPKAHLFGHSDGASIALLVAAKYPQRVASLMLEAPHVFVEPVCIEAIARHNPVPARQALVARLAKYHKAPQAMLDRWLAIWLDPAFTAWSIEQELESITAPLLLIQGEQDEYGSFAQLDRIVGKLGHARQLRLEQCGHSPHRDRGADVLSAAVEFLGLVSGG